MARYTYVDRFYKLPFGFELGVFRTIDAEKSRKQRAFLLCVDASTALCSLVCAAFRWVAIALLVSLFIASFRPAKAAEITIPPAAHKYRAALIGAARGEMGLSAPVALLAAQLHQESRWKQDAVSPVGAQGLAQFMPATARWLPNVAPHTGEPLPFNPAWALRAVCAYDNYLKDRIKNTASACDLWAFTLSSYNGGLGWVQKDRALALTQGLDPARYWGNVETVNAGRKAASFRENRGYPRSIFKIQDIYEKAGWGPGVRCE